jgi:hypothetical protein
MVYDYQPDQVYEVYTQPLRASDICLEPGEKATEAPFISDSERWMLGAGVSQENNRPVQHNYVKPAPVSAARVTDGSALAAPLVPPAISGSLSSPGIPPGRGGMHQHSFSASFFQ